LAPSKGGLGRQEKTKENRKYKETRRGKEERERLNVTEKVERFIFSKVQRLVFGLISATMRWSCFGCIGLR
jgi:hypothetical protein